MISRLNIRQTVKLTMPKTEDKKLFIHSQLLISYANYLFSLVEIGSLLKYYQKIVGIQISDNEYLQEKLPELDLLMHSFKNLLKCEK